MHGPGTSHTKMYHCMCLKINLQAKGDLTHLALFRQQEIMYNPFPAVLLLEKPSFY